MVLVRVSWGSWHSSQLLKLLTVYIFGEECSRHIKELQKSLKAHFSERERADSVFVGECRRIIEMKPEELWGR